MSLYLSALKYVKSKQLREKGSIMSTQNKKIKDMTMLELKEYLQARGVTVTGYLKPALVEIANAVQKMMLPLDSNFECRDDSERKLTIHENEIEDPFVNSHDALDYFNDSPPFGLYDIFNHLIYHTTDYDKQQTIWWFGQSLVCLLSKCHSMKIL